VIVLDSTFLIAYHNARDVHHAAAARTMVGIVGGEWGKIALLEYVFLEIVTVLKLRLSASAAEEVGELLLDSREVDFVPCSDFFSETFSTFIKERASLSFTDAAIVAFARRNAKGRVATFDSDFRSIKGIVAVP
jgi:predicted nucleic acid-binding protein